MPPKTTGVTLAVEGIKPLLKSLAAVDKETRRDIRKTLRHTGDAVRLDAGLRFAKYDEKSAGGYRTIVRQRGIAVEQKYRKTTGKRPKFGKLQMETALLPALFEQAPQTRVAMEHALDQIAHRFNQ